MSKLGKTQSGTVQRIQQVFGEDTISVTSNNERLNCFIEAIFLWQALPTGLQGVGTQFLPNYLKAAIIRKATDSMVNKSY